MWKLLKFLAWLVKACVWLLLLLATAGVAALYVLERGLPEPLVSRLSDACSTRDLVCRIDRATFSLRSGFRIFGIKLLPRRLPDAALVSADELMFDLSLAPKLAHRERLRAVTVRNLSFPALPRHAPGQEPKPDSTPRLPSLAPFALTVERANVLGIQAERVSATLSLTESSATAAGVEIVWTDKAFSMSVAGQASVDFASRIVSGRVKGQAFPSNILPLLEACHAKGAVKQIDCFSKIERPVDAEAQFDVNIDNSDFVLRLGLSVGPCAYRGVPMKFARGPLCAYGTNIYTTVDVGPIEAESSTGPLSGRLVYREEGESLDLDADSAMDLDQFVNIINILNHGQLKPLRCETPPRVRARGVMALDSQASTVTNRLEGTFAFDRGSIFNMRLRDVSGSLQINGYTARLDRIVGSSYSGGRVEGDVAFHFPSYSATSTVFETHVAVSDVDLSELTSVLNMTNSRAGTVSGRMFLRGSACDHTIPTLQGEGHASIRDGLLHRLPLFAGFTDYLARNIPGVSALVNQSSGSMDYVIRDGVLSSDNLLLEGDLFSLNGRGTCNLDTEELRFTVRANIFKEKTFAGKLTRLVTLPFSRLLLEFRVFGTFDKTDWSYVSIIERITEGISDLSTQLRGQPTPSEQPAPPAP